MSFEALLHDRRLYEFLFKCDKDIASEARTKLRPRRKHGQVCGGKLRQGNYERRPRGTHPRNLPEGFRKRFSLCCGREGCRGRAMPPSVRYLSRRVYLSAIVVLVSAMRQGVKPYRAQRLEELTGVSRHTLSRWRQWWQEVFPDMPLWRVARGQWMPPVDAAALPLSLLVRYAGEAFDQLVELSSFLKPITTTSWLYDLVSSLGP